jgi:plastocyanin
MARVSKEQLYRRIDVVRSDIVLSSRVLAANQKIIRGDIKKWKAAQNAANTALSTVENKIKDQTSDMHRYAMTDLVGAAIGGTGEGLVRMTRAFIDGRPREGAAEILRVVGAAANLSFMAKDVFKLTGKVANWAGPIGAIVGEIIGIGVAILEGFSQEQKSIGEELKEALAEFQGKDNLDRLEGLLDSFELSRSKLIGRAPNSMSWDDVDRIGNLTGSVETVFLGAAESYLRREVKAEIWPSVFESYVYARSQSLQNLILGLAAVRKFQNTGEPTEDLNHSINVLTTVCNQCEQFLETFATIAVEKGVRYFIGNNENVYKTENGTDTWIGAYGTVAKTRLAVSSDGERVWHRGSNRGVYTYKEGTWTQITGLTVDDFWMAPAGDEQSHFIALEDSQLIYKRWSESKSTFVDQTVENTLYDQHKPPQVNDQTPVPAALAVCPDGVYFLDGGPRLWIWDTNGARAVATPPGMPIDPLNHDPEVPFFHMAVDGAFLYVSAGNHLWRKARTDVEIPQIAWTTLSSPNESTGIRLPATWTYDDLYAADDGSLLTIVDKRMYSRFRGEWSVVDSNTARHVVKWPVDGHEMFEALQVVVSGMRQTIKELATAEQPMEALPPPVLAEVRVLDTGFEPAKVRIPVGGAVRWVWAGSGAKRIMVHSDSPAFSSPSQSSGTYQHSFVLAGTVKYKADDPNVNGTIEVV